MFRSIVCALLNCFKIVQICIFIVCLYLTEMLIQVLKPVHRKRGQLTVFLFVAVFYLERVNNDV